MIDVESIQQKIVDIFTATTNYRLHFYAAMKEILDRALKRRQTFDLQSHHVETAPKVPIDLGKSRSFWVITFSQIASV